MRISDWSSDVCSSDLRSPQGVHTGRLLPDRRSGARRSRRPSVFHCPARRHDQDQGRQCFASGSRGGTARTARCRTARSEEHTSELQSLMRISSAVFCLKKNKSNDQSLLPINILIITTAIIYTQTYF